MVKVIILNVRGVAGVATMRRLRKLSRIHSLSVLILCEPFVVNSEINSYRDRLGFTHAFAADNCKVWGGRISPLILCHSPHSMSILEVSIYLFLPPFTF